MGDARAERQWTWTQLLHHFEVMTKPLDLSEIACSLNVGPDHLHSAFFLNLVISRIS